MPWLNLGVIGSDAFGYIEAYHTCGYRAYINWIRRLLPITTFAPNIVFNSTVFTYITSMESIPYSNTPSESDRQQSDSEAPTPADGFSITPEDASVLKVYLENFQNSNTETRNKILGKAAGELYALRPPNSAFDKKEAMQVCSHVPMFHLLPSTEHSSNMPVYPAENQVVVL
jgi:hypothetical protein